MGRGFSVVCDIDGVLHRGSKALPGAARFVRELQESGRAYLFLTNSPDQTPKGLSAQLRRFGMKIPATRFYTSAQALAEYVSRRSKKPRVYVIGSKALKGELIVRGAIFSKTRADYVIVGSGGPYGTEEIDTAIRFICKGATFLTANREKASLTESGVKAGCGALIAPIEAVTGCRAYVVGKPNHLMIRAAEDRFGIDPKHALMIGDALDTDVDVGLQAQMTTVLVLSGITDRAALSKSAYKPDYVFPNVSHISLRRLP